MSVGTIKCCFYLTLICSPLEQFNLLPYRPSGSLFLDIYPLPSPYTFMSLVDFYRYSLNCLEGFSRLSTGISLHFINILFDPITAGTVFLSFKLSFATLLSVLPLFIMVMILIRACPLVRIIPSPVVRLILVPFSLLVKLLRALPTSSVSFMGHLWGIFVIILFYNVFGLVPFFFSLTSHFAVTFAFSGALFIGINLIAIRKYGWRAFGLFVPADCPTLIRPLLIVIEFISYFARVLSLSIRLFANITAGHALLKILAGYACFTLLSFGSWFFIGFGVLGLTIAVTILEFFIAILQAYVFIILLCVYFEDVLSIDSH